MGNFDNMSILITWNAVKLFSLDSQRIEFWVMLLKLWLWSELIICMSQQISSGRLHATSPPQQQQQQQQQQQKIKKGKERKINWTPNFLQYDCSKTHHRYTE